MFKTKEERLTAKSASIEQQFLIEYYGESWSQSYTGLAICGGVPGYYGQVCDSWNNTYSCVRMIDATQNFLNGTIYCQFKCFGPGHVEIPCDMTTPQGYGEYYNLDQDYF